MRRVIILCLAISCLPLIQAASSPDVKGYIDGKGYVSEYPDTKITGYYIPNGTGDPWITPEAQSGGFTCVEDGTYCCVPKEKRGFYTEVQCQGTGIRNGEYYRYTQMEETEADSISTESIDEATADDTRPTPNRTIAVNTNIDSKCYIPYGARVYIDTGDEYEGVYIAEDVGAAFEGSGTTEDGQCKIDVFMGEGDDKYDLTLDITQDNTDVYILSWPDKTTPLPSVKDDSSSDHASGTTRSKYENKISLKPPQTMWAIAENTVNQLRSKCSSTTYQKRSQCVKKTLNQISSNHNNYQVQPTCVDSAKKLSGQSSPLLQNKEVYIQGKVLAASNISYIDDLALKTLTVIENEQPVSVPLQSNEDSSETIASIEAGEFVKILGDQSTSPPNLLTTSPLIPSYEQIPLSVYDIEVSQLGDRQRTTQSFLKRAADCKTSSNLCVCNVTHPSVSLTFLNESTTRGTPFEADGVPYNFDIVNASDIDTDINKQKLEQLIDNPTSFKSSLKSKINNKKPNETFKSPSTGDVYLLHSDSRLAFLSAKPKWYEPSSSQNKIVSRYTDVLDQEFSPGELVYLFSTLSTGGITTAAIKEGVKTKLNSGGSQKPIVNECNPTKYHETVCVKQNQTKIADNVETIQQRAMSLPPLKFTVKI